jgi:hypothetical protein
MFRGVVKAQALARGFLARCQHRRIKAMLLKMQELQQKATEASAAEMACARVMQKYARAFLARKRVAKIREGVARLKLLERFLLEKDSAAVIQVMCCHRFATGEYLLPWLTSPVLVAACTTVLGGSQEIAQSCA